MWCVSVARFAVSSDVDVQSPDEKSVITYVSTLFDVFPKVPEGGDGINANVSRYGLNTPHAHNVFTHTHTNTCNTGLQTHMLTHIHTHICSHKQHITYTYTHVHTHTACCNVLSDPEDY